MRTKSVSHPTNKAESVASVVGRESGQRFVCECFAPVNHQFMVDQYNLKPV